MKNRFSTVSKMFVPMLAAAASTAASAQVAGTYSLAAAFNKITPHVESGDVSAPALPGTKADVGSDTEPLLIATYMISGHVSLEAAIGLPYKHDLTGAGAIAGTGKLGSTEVLPPTAFLQYRFFEANAVIRPFVGLGITYAYFRKETGSAQLTALINTGGPATTFRIDNKWAATPQIGIAAVLDRKWFASAAITKTYLKTAAHYSTGQSLDLRLNPISINMGIGYRF